MHAGPSVREEEDAAPIVMGRAHWAAAAGSSGVAAMRPEDFPALPGVWHAPRIATPHYFLTRLERGRGLGQVQTLQPSCLVQLVICSHVGGFAHAQAPGVRALRHGVRRA